MNVLMEPLKFGYRIKTPIDSLDASINALRELYIRVAEAALEFILNVYKCHRSNLAYANHSFLLHSNS